MAREEEIILDKKEQNITSNIKNINFAFFLLF